MALQVSTIHAQDVEQVIKADPLQVSGNVSVTSGASSSYGSNSQRPPFYWSMRGNLNLQLFGLISAPLSFSYSPQGNAFDYPFNRLQPFNQLGISPKYKSITLHLGYRNMNLSRYSLSGNSFNGVGVEWSPKQGNWSAAIAYGRFAKAVNDTSLLNRAGVTLYDRWGYGGKVTRKTKGGSIGFVFFRAKDNPASYPFSELLIQDITPKENLVTGLVIKQQLFKKIRLNLEYNRSAFTENTLSQETQVENQIQVYNAVGGLFTPRQTSSYQSTLDAQLSWSPKIVQVQLAYKRIDPGYYTLGIPFLNNDIEVSSIGLSKRFFENKVSASGNVGLQRNNLDKSQIDETSRLATGLNINYNVSKKVTTMVSYSNYTTNTSKIRIDELDSLTYFQVTENLSARVGYKLSSGKEVNSSMNVQGTLQKADDLNNNGSNIQNYGLSFQHSRKPLALQGSARWSLIITESPGFNRIGTGPSVSLSKKLLQKKVSAKVSFNQIQYYEDNIVMNSVLTGRFSLGVNIKEAHQLSMSGSWLDRKNKDSADSGEIQVSASYSYRFQKDKIIKGLND